MDQLQSIGKILLGNWYGKIGDDIVEESWSIPVVNSIMGMFRWIKDAKIYFYEFVVIDNVEEKIKLKIKHFNSDFTGWEEKTDFIYYVLKDVTDSKIIFGSDDPNEKGRIIYERPDENTLIAILEMAQTGKVLKFEFTKKIVNMI
ncbi:MAG: DUF6265 family protein [Candidatus Hodarchaeota archaeon]